MPDHQPLSGQNITPNEWEKLYPTPNKEDVILSTAIANNATDYQALLYGTPPPENTDPDKLLCQQIPIDWSLVRRLYASDLSGEQVYNFNQNFSGESGTHPIFVRDFIVRRSQYTRTTDLTAQAGLYLARLTAGGSGYTQATVSASLAGGTGSGGAVTPIVSNGAVVHLAITAVGNYTVAPNITINDTGSGAGATGTLSIQPATAVLVKEDELRLGPESPRDSLWVLVRRIYETLPGPDLVGYVMAQDAQGEICTTSRQILASTAAAPTGAFKTLSIQDTPLDANRKVRTSVVLPSATSFPVLTDYDQDPEMQSLITTTFEVVDASAVTSPTITQGVIKRFKHIDKWRSLKITETYATPASFSEQKFSGQHFPNLFNAIYADDDCGVFLDMRGAFNAMVEIRIDISFGNYAQVSGLTIIPNTFAMFAFRVSDVLNDAVTLSATGNCSYTLAIPASSPSKSTYTAYGNTLQLVTGECVLWRAGIFRTTRLYVKMI